MVADPRLCYLYRFFGTYMLQSSFIFLILAQKLGTAADELILSNCNTNLQVLDAFVSVVNIDYQRTFAKILRQTIERKLKRTPLGGRLDGVLTAEQISVEEEDQLDPFLLQIRWVTGGKGLAGVHDKL